MAGKTVGRKERTLVGTAATMAVGTAATTCATRVVGIVVGTSLRTLVGTATGIAAASDVTRVVGNTSCTFVGMMFGMAGRLGATIGGVRPRFPRAAANPLVRGSVGVIAVGMTAGNCGGMIPERLPSSAARPPARGSVGALTEGMTAGVPDGMIPERPPNALPKMLPGKLAVRLVGNANCGHVGILKNGLRLGLSNELSHDGFAVGQMVGYQGHVEALKTGPLCWMS